MSFGPGSQDRDAFAAPVALLLPAVHIWAYMMGVVPKMACSPFDRLMARRANEVVLGTCLKKV